MRLLSCWPNSLPSFWGRYGERAARAKHAMALKLAVKHLLHGYPGLPEPLDDVFHVSLPPSQICKAAHNSWVRVQHWFWRRLEVIVGIVARRKHVEPWMCLDSVQGYSRVRIHSQHSTDEVAQGLWKAWRHVELACLYLDQQPLYVVIVERQAPGDHGIQDHSAAPLWMHTSVRMDQTAEFTRRHQVRHFSSSLNGSAEMRTIVRSAPSYLGERSE